MTTRVVHVRKDAYSVYVGRPMPGFRSIGWGNPFRGENAIPKYLQWIKSQPKLLARLPELKDQILGCWCAPKGGLPADINGRFCHGQVLAALADGVSLDASLDASAEELRSQHLPIKTISLMQPWATLVASGAKRIETRSWAPSPRGLYPGERLAIHASKSFPSDARELCGEEPFWLALCQAGIIDWRDLPLGAVIATVRFDRAISTGFLGSMDFGELSLEESAFGNFGPGRFAWFLSDPQPISPPVPARGSLGLWRWQMPVHASVGIGAAS